MCCNRNMFKKMTEFGPDSGGRIKVTKNATLSESKCSHPRNVEHFFGSNSSDVCVYNAYQNTLCFI